MSRLTAADAKGLMEAYNAVYAPQELTEEQVWEEVENWVNSLVEEGYDLSEYTWEEMYESYIEEAGMDTFSAIRSAQQKPSAIFTRPIQKAPPLGQPGSGFQNTRPPFAGLTVPPTRVGPTIVGPKIVGPKIVGPKIVGPGTPAARPAATAPAARPAATAPASRPAATAPAAPKLTPKPAATSSTPRPKDTSITDMIGRSQVRQGTPINTGSTSSDARAIAARSSAGATSKPAASAPAAKQSPRQARLNMEMEYDTFDTVLEYLVSEGYADTEESALVIMANMSEEWREGILDEGFKRMNRRKIEKQAQRLGGDKTITLRSLANTIDTPEWRKHSTSQARRNRAGGAGSEYRKGKELQARDDAKADIKKYGLY